MLEKWRVLVVHKKTQTTNSEIRGFIGYILPALMTSNDMQSV